MRAMLKEVGIPSNYVTISTTNRRLLKDFASVGQMNHVILQVPLPAIRFGWNAPIRNCP